MFKKIIFLVSLLLLTGCSNTYTIKTVCVEKNVPPEIVEEKETENHNCSFLKKLGGTSGKQYDLWECDEGYKLYYID